MKALWNKYPCPELSFVKEHKVIGLEKVSDDKLVVQKLMYCSKLRFLKTLTVEEMHFDFKKQTLVSRTKFLKASGFWSQDGVEEMTYKSADETECTLCSKVIHGATAMKSSFDKFFSSFKQGCQVVERNARSMVEKASL
eukprot:CAMPEP_0176444072 /NCGR_PEP_ID=MMETSP0127-20121128/22833_1 /TAXON_ID=938130 /ORGANISM="Platyophrya macrostoma, Strain WH" /LENGTH=138 /DNA_ID=CAMNT_0017829487 /DNA_START=76 /DNA_END=492 /DNA_ORIENTATION=-